MQSYEHHIVRETLEMRHPYLQDEAFTPEIEAEQVSVITLSLTNLCY
jgi:hypothetical protein